MLDAAFLDRAGHPVRAATVHATTRLRSHRRSMWCDVPLPAERVDQFVACEGFMLAGLWPPSGARLQGNAIWVRRCLRRDGRKPLRFEAHALFCGGGRMNQPVTDWPSLFFCRGYGGLGRSLWAGPSPPMNLIPWIF